MLIRLQTVQGEPTAKGKICGTYSRGLARKSQKCKHTAKKHQSDSRRFHMKNQQDPGGTQTQQDDRNLDYMGASQPESPSVCNRHRTFLNVHVKLSIQF